jgi:hypothetical protein
MRIYDKMFGDIVEAAPHKWSDYVNSEDQKSKTGKAYVGVLGDLAREVSIVHFQHYPQDFEEVSQLWQQQLETEPHPFQV